MPRQCYCSQCVLLDLLVQALLAGQGHALFHFTHRDMPATNPSLCGWLHKPPSAPDRKRATSGLNYWDNGKDSSNVFWKTVLKYVGKLFMNPTKRGINDGPSYPSDIPLSNIMSDFYITQ